MRRNCSFLAVSLITHQQFYLLCIALPGTCTLLVPHSLGLESVCCTAFPTDAWHVHPPPPAPQIDEGLKSLDTAMNCGFEDYQKIRSDKNLANLRQSPKFEPLVEKYDEPVINWRAVESTFGAFGKLFKKN